MTHNDVFDEFIRMAKKEREKKFLKFNEKTSCLRYMVAALKEDLIRKNLPKPRFDQIRRTLEQKSPNDSKKYQAALNFVEANWPNWNRRGVKVMPSPGTTSALRHSPPRVPPRPGRPHPDGVGVTPIGWEYVAFNPAVHTFTSVTAQPHQPELNKSQTMRINESLQRAKYAVENARDVLIRIKSLNWSALLNPDQRSYVDFFGSYDSDRYNRVLENFKVLVLAFQKGPKIIDLRNTTYGLTCYAACYRHDLRTTRHGSLSLSGKVDMFLGRSYFTGGGDYSTSTDATVGTLVHEFAHGAINAVDAPPVNQWGTGWVLTPNLDPNHNDYGASPQNHIQASTENADKALALFNADIAVRNADNYGQFTRILLMRRGK